jgi:hypothetical protein
MRFVVVAAVFVASSFFTACAGRDVHNVDTAAPIGTSTDDSGTGEGEGEGEGEGAR